MKQLSLMVVWFLVCLCVNAEPSSKSEIKRKIQALGNYKTYQKKDHDKEKLVVYKSLLKKIAQLAKRAEMVNSLNDHERAIASFATKIQDSKEQKRIAEIQAWYGHDSFNLPEEQFVIWRKENRVKRLERFVKFSRRHEKKDKKFAKKITDLETWYGCKIEELPQKYFEIRNEEKDSLGGGLEWIDLTKEGNDKVRKEMVEELKQYAEGPSEILDIRPEHMKEEYLTAWAYWLMSPAKNRARSRGLAYYPQFVMSKQKKEALYPFVEFAFMSKHRKYLGEYRRTTDFDEYGQWLYEVSPEKSLNTCLKLHRINRYIVKKLRKKIDEEVTKKRKVQDTKKKKSIFDTGSVDTTKRKVQNLKELIKQYELQNIQLVAFLSSKDTSIVKWGQTLEEGKIVNDYWKTFKPIIKKRLEKVTDKTPKEDVELMKAALCAALVASAEKRPNILFIFADDMGYGDLGCYGSTQVKTPNIDALAEGGVKFTNAYVSAPVCAPSRAGLLTGRYQGRFGFEHNLATPSYVKPERVGIPLDEILISDRLKKLGYRTGIVGKWHVGAHLKDHHPNARGFDYFYGMLGGGHTYFPTAKNSKLLENEVKVTEFKTPYLTDIFTDKAISFMKPKLEKPWYLYLSYNSPHSPMQAKEEDLEDYAGISGKTRRIYCAMQQCMDENIGRLVKHLKDTNQYDNTLIVFFNDNGGSVEVSNALNAPLTGTKGTFLEGGIRVPMIMHWPSKIKANSVYDKPVISLDFTPTLVGIAGGAVEEEQITKGGKSTKRIRDGVDLMPYITGKKEGRPHKSLYWRMLSRGGAIRSGDWKLIKTPHHATMLFNLKEDISEQNNLATQMPEKVAELTKEYHLWLESFETNPMWISDVMWSKYNRKLYEAEYQLVQPEEQDKTE